MIRKPAWARLARRDGAVSIMMAASAAVMLSMAGLGTHWGFSLAQLTRNQRVADIAAYAGALGYSQNGTTGMAAAAKAVAALNGNLSGYTATSIATSPRANGTNAVLATVGTPYTVIGTSHLGSLAVTLNKQAYAEIKQGANPCILALNTSGTGLTLSGGTVVKASGCAVSSDQSIQVPCGTTLQSDVVTYNTAPPSQPGCVGIKPYSAPTTSIVQVKVADPIASNAQVAADTARLTTAAAVASPAAPSVPGGNSLNFQYYPATLTTGNACTATLGGSTWTVKCPAGGTYNFGGITMGGGLTINFDTSGTNSTYNFLGAVLVTSKITFGSGTFNLAGGLVTGGGTTTTFGGGTVKIGRNSGYACNGGGSYSICNTGTSLTFGGPTTMTLSGGLYNAGGSTLSIGAGSTANSYTFGSSSDGYAIYVGGGSTTTLGDSGVANFTVNGNIGSGGGSCMSLPAAAQHDINGYINLGGGLTMGSGTWTITKYVDIGGNGGGDVGCGGSTIGVTANNVTIVVGGTASPSDGCSGNAFCVGSGFGHVTIVAPSAGANASLAVIGPPNNAAGVGVNQGAANTQVTGVFYFPNGPILLSGAGSLGSSGCLELIGSQVTLTGGSALGSNCPNINSVSSGGGVRLVQ